MLPGLRGEPGEWRARVGEFDLYVVADEAHDRLRIMIPVAEVERHDCDLLWVLLYANYDRALDARYAVQDGLVWSVFLHRLSWLTVEELQNAVRHVVTLAESTGSSFGSSDLAFGRR